MIGLVQLASKIMVKKFSPREAMKVAKKLGWEVTAGRRSGDIEFRPPGGGRYSCRAPGRADIVPLDLCRALEAALEEED